MADGDDQHGQPVVLDLAHDAVITDPVAPKSGIVACQGLAEAAGVVIDGDPRLQVAKDAPLGFVV